MQELYIGEVIKQRRMELKLTQEELCEGICEPSTISRIESGKQIPVKSKLDALLQRLGLLGDRYYALVSKHELEISNLKAEIITHNIRKEPKIALKKLNELEEMIDENDHFLKQFILRTRAALGYLHNGKVEQYNFQEKIDLLYKAIYLTVPSFQINKISHHLYSVEEIKIINQIALSYSDIGQNKTAIGIYSQLLKYINSHFFNMSETNRLSILIAYNYSRSLYFEEEFQKSIEVASLGLQQSRQESSSAYLGGLLSVLGHAFYAQKKFERSKEYFYQAFYMYTMLNDQVNTELSAQNLKDFFNIDVCTDLNIGATIGELVSPENN